MTALPQAPKLHGRRLGRPLRAGQRRLIEQHLPALRIAPPPPGERLDPAGLFDAAPRAVWLEIGFGAGEHLAEQAAAHPEVGLIGCEVFVNGIASLLREIEQRRLANLRIYQDDARGLIEVLPEASLTRCFLLFPDPWPKTRHGKRRFIQPATLDRLARVLADGAEFRFATDDPAYLRWTLRHLLDHPAFDWPARGPDDWRVRADDWPATRYEAKALRAGRQPSYLRFRRRAREAACERP